MTTSGAALLKRIKPRLKRVRVHVCLRPDLLAEFHKEDSELNRMIAQDVADQTPEGRPRLSTGEVVYSEATQAQAEKVDKLEKRIDAADVVFEMEALPKDEWATHVSSHPARKDNTYDMLVGYDRDATLDSAVRRCLVDPEFEDCPSVADSTIECDHAEGAECDGGSWQAFERVCASSEWEALKLGVQQANEENEDNPKSVQASRVLASSAASSTSARRTESRSARSTGGRRGKSSSTR